jgi:hypothetical protein
MLASNWQPTAHLRYAAVSGQMQQLWERECRETREYNGRPRLCTWTEQQWRDIPFEQPTQETCEQCSGTKRTPDGLNCTACNAMGESAAETPAAPRGKPCTCSDVTESACGLEQGFGKLGDLWYCRRLFGESC